MQSGIFYDIPAKEYHAWPAFGSSQMKYMLKTPKDFKAALELKVEPTRAMILGSAIHTAILEPDKFDGIYAWQKEDYGKRNVGEGKKRWDEFKKANEGKIILDLEEIQMIERIKEEAAQHESLQEVLADGKAEVSAVTPVDFEEKLWLKGRFDWLTSSNCLWDVKTTDQDVTSDEFRRIVWKYHYDFQLVHYSYIMRLLGKPIQDVGIIFVKKPSWDAPAVHIKMVTLSEHFLGDAKAKHEQAVETLLECTRTGEWPGIDDAIGEL